jgi:hypothetical protein
VPIVDVTGWRRDFKTISFVKLLRQGSQADRSLVEAKALVDGLLEGKHFSLRFEQEDEAAEFIGSAELLGAIASLGENDQKR